MKKKPFVFFFISFNILFLCSVSCGVKGVPLPPLSPAPIGNGEMVKLRPIRSSKKGNKYQYNKNESVDEEEDFTHEGP